MIGCLGEKVERLFGSCVGRWFGRWFGGGLEAGWEVVWRLVGRWFGSWLGGGLELGREVIWKLVGRWFGTWLGGGLEAVWEVVWRLGEASGEASGEVPGEVSGDAFGETLGDGSRTVWASRNAVFLQCIVASAESRKSTQEHAIGNLPGPNKSTKTQREGNCLRTRITCPRHGGGCCLLACWV